MHANFVSVVVDIGARAHVFMPQFVVFEGQLKSEGLIARLGVVND